MRRFVLHLSVSIAVVLTLFSLPHLLYAFQDSTGTSSTDHTGFLGPVIDYWFLPAIVLLQSAATKLFAFITPAWQRLSQILKWTILYGTGLLITFVGAKLGWLDLHVTGDTLTQLGTSGVLALFPTAAAGLVYKIAGHKVPPPPPSTTSGR